METVYRKISLTIVLLSILMAGCKKIPLNEPDAKAILGKWQYLNSSGGLGGTDSNGAFDKNTWIEFKETGKYQVYKSCLKIHSENYKIESKTTGDDVLTIVYDKKTSQLFAISGDSLFLIDKAHEAFSYTFVRK